MKLPKKQRKKEKKYDRKEKKGRRHFSPIIEAPPRKPEVRGIPMQEEVDANLYNYNLRMMESSRFFSLSQK